MANVIGVPAFLASSTSGFSVCGVLIPFASSSFSSVIAWPLRLRTKGMTMFFGEPKSPIVEAKGIPNSIWVAWFSPRVSRSRITAQEASFEMTDSMPYF